MSTEETLNFDDPMQRPRFTGLASFFRLPYQEDFATNVRAADIGDAWISRPYELEGAHKEIQDKYEAVHAAGIVPLTCGGDHSISLPILRAIAKDGPVGMIHIDAHCDTGDNYMGSRFHHGAPFKVAVDEGLLDPKRTAHRSISVLISTASTPLLPPEPARQRRAVCRCERRKAWSVRFRVWTLLVQIWSKSPRPMM